MTEICAATGVGADTIRDWINEGAPIAIEKSGARVRYSAELAQLQAWRLQQSKKRQGNT